LDGFGETMLFMKNVCACRNADLSRLWENYLIFRTLLHGKSKDCFGLIIIHETLKTHFVDK